MKYRALIHEAKDDVAVVIQDVAARDPIKIFTLEGTETGSVEAVEPIALGHKIAVRAVSQGKEVLEYGRPIGKATEDVAIGAHVHVHNLKSIRWGQR
jgi:(2R)-sulfolactate sulfo-lyase subunit alpha